jgi:hypothetical protein
MGKRGLRLCLVVPIFLELAIGELKPRVFEEREVLEHANRFKVFEIRIV